MNRTILILAFGIISQFSFGQINVVSNIGKMSEDQQKAFNVFKSYMGDCLDRDLAKKYWVKTNQKSYDNIFTEGFWNPSLYEVITDAKVLSIENLAKQKQLLKVEFGPNAEIVPKYAIVNYIYKAGKLDNYTNYYTKGWRSSKLGMITYKYPKSYSFNKEKAEEAIKFVDKLQRLFKLDKVENITYFIAKDCKEVRKVQGFDFVLGEGQEQCAFFDGVNNFVYTNQYAGENHQHELIHIVNKKYPKANYLFLSGLAVYNRGENVHQGHSLAYHSQKIVDALKGKTSYDLFYNDEAIKIEGTSVDYFIGAALIQMYLKNHSLESFYSVLEESNSEDYFRKNYQLFGANSFEDLNVKVLKTIAEFINPETKLLLDLN